MLKDGHSQTGLILLCNGSALTVSYIGPQCGLSQEFIAVLYNVKIGDQVPAISVHPHKSLGRETVEKVSGVLKSDVSNP